MQINSLNFNKPLKYPVITNAYAELEVKMMVVRIYEIWDDREVLVWKVWYHFATLDGGKTEDNQ